MSLSDSLEPLFEQELLVLSDGAIRQSMHNLNFTRTFYGAKNYHALAMEDIDCWIESFVDEKKALWQHEGVYTTPVIVQEMSTLQNLLVEKRKHFERQLVKGYDYDPYYEELRERCKTLIGACYLNLRAAKNKVIEHPEDELVKTIRGQIRKIPPLAKRNTLRATLDSGDVSLVTEGLLLCLDGKQTAILSQDRDIVYLAKHVIPGLAECFDIRETLEAFPLKTYFIRRDGYPLLTYSTRTADLDKVTAPHPIS